MANKTELLARIEDLSAQLGRELPTTGTMDVLQSVIESAEAELALLNEMDSGLPEPVQSTLTATEQAMLNAGNTERSESDIPEPAYRYVKLRNTLDIIHYVNQKPTRSIVLAGESIYVDPEEAAALIAQSHVYAL